MTSEKTKEKLDHPMYKMKDARAFVGPTSTPTMKMLEKYLDTEVKKDLNGHRRYTKRQLITMRKVWLAKHPNLAV